MYPLLTAIGCASVIPQYEAAMERALADPGPTPTEWVPDAVLHLSSDTINDVVQSSIEDYGTFSSTFDFTLVQLSPDMGLAKMEISAGNRCDDCLGIAIELDGELKWSSAVLGTGSTDLGATGSLDARFSIDQNAEGDFIVTVQPHRFRFLDVTLGPVNAGVAGLGETIQDWIDRNLVAQVPPQEIMVIAREDLPLADVKIVPDEDSIQLHLLTMAAERGRVATQGPKPETGWRMDISTDSLIALARAEAFQAEKMSRGIVAEPTLLSMDGEAFQMGLRLWRTEGRGWWRDYIVDGAIAVEQDEIRLTATGVQQTGRSPGAAGADPLSALAKGLILRYIENAFETSIPAAQGEGTVVLIESIKAMDGAIRAGGSLSVETTEEPIYGPPM